MNLFEFEIPYSGRRYNVGDLSALFRLIVGGAVFGIVMHFGGRIGRELDKRVDRVGLGQYDAPEPEENDKGIRVIA